MLKILSWNIAHRRELWRTLLDSDADVALLQEACEPPSDIASQFKIDLEPWRTEGMSKRLWRTAVVGLNPQVQIERIVTRSICEAEQSHLAVTRMGTIAAAHVHAPVTNEVYSLISMYSTWEKPQSSTLSSWIYSDGSVHRLISDISGLVGAEKRHRIVAAGDLNILHGYGESGNRYWGDRYQIVFDRFNALGMDFIGPQFPNGRQANPWPSELPTESLNVPTYFTTQQKTPEHATRQLDFVFASRAIAERVQSRALNGTDEWGGSDHCRIQIEIT